jgi:acetoacetyl-[acyl-carrier protein] synthase
VQAHGSSTPQNRTTESRIMNLVAGAFGIEDWPVTAIKAFVGHSLAPASADQMTVTLGVLRHGVMPGIKTIDKLADDLDDSHLAIALKDVELGDRAEVAFLNSKGFGGNNATGAVISPRRTEAMLAQRHGAQAMAAWRGRREAVLEKAQAYDAECLAGPMQPIYRFGDALIEENDITIDTDGVHIPGFAHEVDLRLANRYGDMCE